MPKKISLRMLDEFAEEKFGKRGTKMREKVEQGFEELKRGVLIFDRGSEKTRINPGRV